VGSKSRAETAMTVCVSVALVLVFWFVGPGAPVRVAALQLLGCVTLAALAMAGNVSMSPGGSHGPGGDIEWRRSGRAVAALALVFLTLAAMSVATSVNRGVSLSAAATLLAGVAFMFAAARVPRRVAVLLLAAQCALALPIAASAVLEPFGRGWLPANDYYPGRAMANMGGPGPLGALMAAVIPIAAGFVLASGRRARSIAAGLATIVLIAALTATFSRAALIAVIVGLAVLILLLVRAVGFGDRRRIVRRRALVVLAMLAIIVPAYNAAVLVSAPAEYRAGSRPGTQTFEIPRRIEGTDLTNSRVRFLCWGTAAELTIGHPLTGAGAGCFGIAAEAVMPEALQHLAAARGFVYDVAYNDYLQFSAELGLPAAVVFLALVAAALARTRTGLRAGVQDLPRTTALAGAAGAVAALLTQGLIDFPLHLPAHLTLLWIDLGLIAALASPDDSGRAGEHAWSAGRKIASAAIVLVALAVGALAVRAIAAGLDADRAVRLSASGRGAEAEALAARAARLNPHEYTYWVLLGELAEREGAPRTVFEAYRNASRAWPHHAPAYGRAGALYLEHSERVPGAADSALTNIERAIDCNPYYAEPHTNLGTVLMTDGDYEGARAEFLRAAELDTLAPAPLFNLGNLEAKVGDTAEAKRRYLEALSRDPDHVKSLTNLGTVLLGQGRQDEALLYLKRAHELDPNSTRILGLMTLAERGHARTE
jgi:tetratricopeptide (TPR) repeat protein